MNWIKHSLSALILLVLVNSCDTSKTVIIDKVPSFAGKAIELYELPNDISQEVIRIGELNSITNLDPLFVSNNGEMRILNLVYQGLIGIDNQGKLKPAIANSWKISPDSLTYEFYLGSNRFHDSDLFLNGIGRAITSEDVKYVFERMAQNTVPTITARLFWAIRGMDSYYLEQHELFDPSKRSLTGISGIETPDSQTIIFTLDFKDPSFLKNLANPRASIYPKESVHSNILPIQNWPIGSNSWKFSGLFRDSIITLKPITLSTNLTEKVLRKRIEFYFFKSEISLYKKFFLDEIDVVPELGPQLSKSILNPAGLLSEAYKDKFSLYNAIVSEPFRIYLNAENRFKISKEDALHFFNGLNLSSYSINSPIWNSIHVEKPSSTNFNSSMNKFSQFDKGQSNNRISFGFNNNPISLELMRMVYSDLSPMYNVVLINSPIVGRETLFYVRTNKTNSVSHQILAEITLKRTALQKNDRVYAQFSPEPWWMNIPI